MGKEGSYSPLGPAPPPNACVTAKDYQSKGGFKRLTSLFSKT